MPTAVDDCFRHDDRVLTHEEAVALILARVPAVAGTERVPVEAAVGRVLAEDIHAPRDVPLTDTSAVDGWAFAHADYAASNRLPVSRRIMAGRAAPDALATGTAARIFTGAAMPEGADTVAMQEDCRAEETADGLVVVVPPGLRPGANRRRAGEDLVAGALVARAGTGLRPQDLAAIGSLGLAEISVTRRLRVALCSTGDEIVRPGGPIRPGEVYDSNHVLLASLFSRIDADVDDLGILPDDAGSVRAALATAAASHDLVLTSGGTSRGEGDHVADAVDALGHRHLWHLAVKPGRPLSFGQIGDCLFLGLPGNPVAALVGFLLYGQPLLARLSGRAWRPPVRYPLPAAFAIPSRKTGRREFLRGILITRPDGSLAVDKYARDGSGLITGLRAADGLVEIPEQATSVVEGATVAFIPFTEFGLPPRQTATD
ncbi:gephyrin-like molybdotransferase Glp [Methylobrevis pamukkalensis]|uniref:molybdopterin molybdotransferase MoeA n=1 Tax=Methylobrevis pamukkalensis TaxID=1439726 RepID=UPI000A799DD6|nr:gephyrin-like molybdotransferase Glp [Methylobrevis pamukkalensis]